MDNHGTLRKGEHEFDLGVWDNYHLSMRTKEKEGGELMGGRQFPSSPTNGRIKLWHMGISEAAWCT